jgi:hypothetical protein
MTGSSLASSAAKLGAIRFVVTAAATNTAAYTLITCRAAT